MNITPLLAINMLYVFMGAGIGGCARYAVNLMVSQANLFSFSLATLLVNVIGAFLAGFITNLPGFSAKPYLFLFLFTGFLGGFTTFSAFTFEGVKLLQVQPLFALGHVLLHVLGCFIAFYMGNKLVHLAI